MIVRTIAPEGMPRPTGVEGHVLLDAIWRHFRDHLRWPSFDQIDRRLYAAGLSFEEAVQQLCPALLRGLDPDISRMPQGAQELSLTVAGAANCTDTGPATIAFLYMVRIAAAIEPHYQPEQPGEQPVLKPVDLSRGWQNDPKLLTKEVMFAAYALGLHEPCFHGGGANPEDLSWSLHYDRGIRPFADVHRLDDYWRIREQVIGPTRAEADNRPFAKHQPQYFPAPAPAAPPALPATASEPETMSVTCALHPEIEKVAAERYNSGFYYDAVSRAFQAVEHRVQTLVGAHEVGEKLMGIALGKPTPKITVTRSTGGSVESEQTGMQFLFKGSMLALRNPRMHGPDQKDARDEADEMLVFASFLMRRLDIEDEQRKAAASGP